MTKIKSLIEKVLTLSLLAETSTLQIRNKKKIGQVFTAGIFIILAASSGALAAENGTVIIAFDDGWTDALSNAYTILKDNGQKAVVFAIPEPIIGGWGGYLSVTDLASLYDAGWDISSHSQTHGSKYVEGSPEQLFYLTRANNTELKTELGDSKDWLDSNGFTRSSMFFAYPYGTYDNAYCMEAYGNVSICGSNDLAAEIKAAGYYIGARSIDAYSWRHAGKHPKYKKGDADALKMATMAIDNTPDSYPAAVIEEINRTIKEGGLLVLTFHHISTGDPTNSEEYSLANLTMISNYLKSNSSVQVQTFSEYFAVPNPIPTYTPGTPIAGESIIGSNWINTQWIDGAGDMTDVFDVRIKKGSDTVGQVTYNVVNRYFNITGISPNTPLSVEVTAINRSWGKTNINQTPLLINAIIPTYIPPTPVNATLAGSKNLSWKAGSGNTTNYFNILIDGVWTNGTITEFYDIAGKSPGLYTVNVYAVNSSNGLTISEMPLTLSATIDLPTYMPPIPLISNMTGSDWILTQWDAGEGSNKTDSFDVNVNGIQVLINTTNKSYNVTNLSPGNYTNVEVYAVNLTNGRTTSIPVTMNTSLPVPTTTPAPVSSGGGRSGSSGGSGGGGGGGVSSAEQYANILKYEIQEHEVFVNPVSFKYKTPELGVYEVIVTANQSNIASLRIEVLKNKSGLVGTSAPAIVYKNLNIWIDYKRIKSTLIRFKVENSWISSNGLSSADIKMYRWDNNSKIWIELSTDVLNKDDKYTYYESQADRISASFAISGIKEENVPVLPESSINLAQVGVEQTENIPVNTIPKALGFGIMLSAVSIFSMVYLLKRIKR